MKNTIIIVLICLVTYLIIRHVLNSVKAKRTAINDKAQEEFVLCVRLNEEDICLIKETELPCEMRLSHDLPLNSELKFVEHNGITRTHSLMGFDGIINLSIRIGENKACQVDCLINTKEERNENVALDLSNANAAIRFQPFIINDNVINGKMTGMGLFHRGIHYAGHVTDAKVISSVLCDSCNKSFMFKSLHAGFGNFGYFYSGTGIYTLIVDNEVPGCPVVLSDPDEEGLSKLENSLPLAPDGSYFKYRNSFKCPHCSFPFIDFEKNIKIRKGEYYANIHLEKSIIKYNKKDDQAAQQGVAPEPVTHQ